MSELVGYECTYECRAVDTYTRDCFLRLGILLCFRR